MKKVKLLMVTVLVFMLMAMAACSKEGNHQDILEDVEQESTDAEVLVEQCPWNNGGKKPSEYTWEEFEALTSEQQDYFFEWFENSSEFESWMDEAKQNSVHNELPWNNGGKKPSEYTWEEFETLTSEQQDYFFEWFESSSEFKSWMDEAKQNSVHNELPWNNGGKKPSEYTWEEFEALNGVQQELFFEWFESSDDFEDWMEKVKK